MVPESALAPFVIVIADVVTAYAIGSPASLVTVHDGEVAYAVAKVTTHPVATVPSVTTPCASELPDATAGEVPQDDAAGGVELTYWKCPSPKSMRTVWSVPLPLGVNCHAELVPRFVVLTQFSLAV